MFTKNRIKLFIALGLILIIGFTNVIFNLRPVSERKKNKQEKIDTRKELQNILDSIEYLSNSISKNNTKSILYLKRARHYKSINKFDKAIVDYNKFLENNDNTGLVKEVEKELKSCKVIQQHINK